MVTDFFVFRLTDVGKYIPRNYHKNTYNTRDEIQKPSKKYLVVTTGNEK